MGIVALLWNITIQLDAILYAQVAARHPKPIGGPLLPMVDRLASASILTIAASMGKAFKWVSGEIVIVMNHWLVIQPVVDLAITAFRLLWHLAKFIIYLSMVATAMSVIFV